MEELAAGSLLAGSVGLESQGTVVEAAAVRNLAAGHNSAVVEAFPCTGSVMVARHTEVGWMKRSSAAADQRATDPVVAESFRRRGSYWS